MRRFKTLLTLGLVPCFGACAGAETATEEAEGSAETAPAEMTAPAAWSYAGATGPQAWGSLSDEFAVCSAGTEQSPIDVPTADAVTAELAPLQFSYSATGARVEDGGHGVLVTPDAPQTLAIGGDEYSLLQFHGHGPSEHTIDGRSFPLELHFVHQNDAGELAVVGFMVEEGAASAAYAPVVEALGGEGSAAALDLGSLLPDESPYFTYPGSLTTPPCSEGVRWILLADAVELSAEQISALLGGHGATNRPVQPLADREVRVSG